jgi:hypothetical protein
MLTIEYYEQSLAIARLIGDRRGEAITSWNLGEELAKQGNLARAVPLMQLCVDFERGLGHIDTDADARQVENLRQQLTAQQVKPAAKYPGEM